MYGVLYVSPDIFINIVPATFVTTTTNTIAEAALTTTTTSTITNNKKNSDDNNFMTRVTEAKDEKHNH